jgi:branched-chain amino acid transport system substrate-binding protein
MKALQVLGGAALGLVLAGAAQAETVKVGVVLPFSGPNADIGNQIVNGLDLYLKVHQKELGSNKIELIKRDSGPPTGAGAKVAATEMITQDHVQILTGFAFSPDAIATAPVATQAKVPMIISNAGTAWIPSLSPYIVRVSFSMWHAAYPMGGYAVKNLGCHTAAVGYSDYPPGKDSLQAFKTGFEAAGGKVIDEIPMGGPAQVPDYTPFLQRVKDEHPNCLYAFVPAGNHAAALMRVYGELGMRQAGIKLVGPLDLIPDDHLQAMGHVAVGFIAMGHYAYDYTNAANKAFVADWHAAYGDKSVPNFMAVQGWDSMAAIFHAVKELHGKVGDGAKVIKSLEGWSTDSPRGEITIDPNTRDVIESENVEEVVLKPDGTLGVKVLETIPNVKDPCKQLKVGRCGS